MSNLVNNDCISNSNNNNGNIGHHNNSILMSNLVINDCISNGNNGNIGQHNNSDTKLKVYLTNARSLRNKFQELVSLVTLHKFDIVCISESWVSEKFNQDILTEYDISGFNRYSYERETRQGGGVILYVNKRYLVEQVQNIKLQKDVESVWLDMKTIGNIQLRLGLFYRSPCPPRGENILHVKGSVWVKI